MFFADQCRHCIEAPCEAAAGEPTAIFTEAATGAVIYPAGTRELDAAEIRESCPYDIPRKAEDGTLAKCDMCDGCKKYLKTLDSRETERMIYTPLKQIASLHLDYKAKEMGYESGIQLTMPT